MNLSKNTNEALTERLRTEYDKRFRSRGDGADDPLHDVRREAMETFSKTGIPLKSEAWKYTRISDILDRDLPPVDGFPTDLVDPKLPELGGWVAVCVNGRFRPDRSTLPTQGGVSVFGLADAAVMDPALAREQLGSYAPVTAEPMVALNGAFATDGLYIKVEDGVQLEAPIHILNYVASEASLMNHARHLILIGESASATVIEYDTVAVSDRCFTNSVVEAHVGRLGVLNHYRLQEKWGADHVDSTYVRQEEQSEYRSCVVSTGDGIVRNNLTALVAGEYCHTELRGLSIAGGNGHIDHFTLIDHAEPNCTSNELYKSILAGKAESVFRGKLFVHKDAQKTSAFQSNRNLLLSRDAVANALPQLEIYADDVKCSHGATTGVLDQEALFYLRSRGISRPMARKLLVQAFVGEVVVEIEDETFRARIDDVLDTFLNTAEL